MTWIAENIDRWRIEEEKWFNTDLIPDEMLPKEDLEAEGGAQKRRSSNVSSREGIELTAIDNSNSSKVHPESTTVSTTLKKEKEKKQEYEMAI